MNLLLPIINAQDRKLVTASTTRQTSLEQALEKFELTQLPLIQMEQVHGTEIAVIEKAETQTVPGVDALLTTLTNVVLCVRTADCIPVLIYHPTGLIGVVHCGRQSTELGLLRKVMEKIKTEFKISKDLQLWFGPAICERCYQIEQEKDVHYNLVRKNFQQVLEVFPEGADVSPANFCTFHQNENFYSYRKEGADVSRNYSLIARVN